MREITLRQHQLLNAAVGRMTIDDSYRFGDAQLKYRRIDVYAPGIRYTRYIKNGKIAGLSHRGAWKRGDITVDANLVRSEREIDNLYAACAKLDRFVEREAVGHGLI